MEWMAHRKWRETKQQPSRARSGHQIRCCLVSLHFLCDILAPITVHYWFPITFPPLHDVWSVTYVTVEHLLCQQWQSERCGAAGARCGAWSVEVMNRLIRHGHVDHLFTPHIKHMAHLLTKLVSPKTEMVEKTPRNLSMSVAIWTNQIASFYL